MSKTCLTGGNMSVVTLNDLNFENEVLKSDKTVLVDFWASWCAPCRMVSPLIEELSQEHPEYKFCKVNVDEEGNLAQKYNITSIPQFYIFKNGKIINQSVGAIPKERILGLLK